MRLRVILGLRSGLRHIHCAQLRDVIRLWVAALLLQCGIGDTLQIRTTATR